MPQIVSVSRRSDVPAFQWDWFLGSLQNGFVDVKNPFSGKPYRVLLSPSEVDCFVFWTKNPEPMVGSIDDLMKAGYPFIFHVTVNGYGREIEKNVPATEKLSDLLRIITGLVGREKIFWRFDPLLPFEDPGITVERFLRVGEKIGKYVSSCFVSQFHPYRKSVRKMAKIGLAGDGGMKSDSASRILEEGRRLQLDMVSCSSGNLIDAGYREGACIDGPYLSKIFGKPGFAKPRNPTRPGCNCTDSRDIGSYGSCSHECVYCYAS